MEVGTYARTDPRAAARFAKRVADSNIAQYCSRALNYVSDIRLQRPLVNGVVEGQNSHGQYAEQALAFVRDPDLQAKLVRTVTKSKNAQYAERALRFVHVLSSRSRWWIPSLNMAAVKRQRAH